MTKKKKYLAVLALLPMLALASCGGGTTSSSVTTNTNYTTKFSERFDYTVIDGGDGINANITGDDPGSYDDTVSLTKFKYTSNVAIPGYYENNKITVENSVRTEIATDYGDGYPITNVADNCFKSLTSVTEISLGNKIKYIGNDVFSGDTALTSINLTSLTNLEHIGTNCFSDVPWYNTYLSSHQGEAIIFGNVLYAVSGDLSSSSYTVPDNVVEIADGAFKGQTNLTSVTFSANSKLKKIGANAFEGTGLTSISVPTTCTSIGDSAFKDCTKLTTVDFKTASLSSNCLLDDANVTSLTFLGDKSASSCFGSSTDLSKIKSVSLTGINICDEALKGLSGVTSLSLKGVEIIGKDAFAGMTSLATITDSASVEFVANNCLSSSVWYSNQPSGPVIIGYNLLGFKGNQTAFNFSASIGGFTFGIVGVSAEVYKDYSGALTIPTSVKYVGDKAFNGCENLTSVDLPNAVSIGDSAFGECSRLTSCKLSDNCELGDSILNDNNVLTELAVPFGDAPSGIVGTGGNIKTTLTTLTILEGPTAVSKNAYKNYKALTSVTFSDTIETIDNSAFEGCIKLKSVDLPSSITTLGNKCFYNCTKLSKVGFHTVKSSSDTRVIYKGVESLGQFVFALCESLTSSTINGESYGDTTFVMPESLTTVKGCSLMGTAVEKIVFRVPDYYMSGVVVSTSLKDDQEYISLTNDWNSDTIRGTDKDGNPYKIPYEVETIDTTK